MYVDIVISNVYNLNDHFFFFLSLLFHPALHITFQVENHIPVITSIKRTSLRSRQVGTLPLGPAQVGGHCEPVSCCSTITNFAACSY